VERVVVVGNSGSGKTTVARRLAMRLGVPHVELDAIYHQPGWTPLPAAEFTRRVADAVAGDGWVVDGNYSPVRAVVWERATTVVWMDPPRHVVMRRLILRTLFRAAGRVELWNGNRERWLNLFSLDPERSVIAWAWQQHRRYRERYAALATDPVYSHLTFKRIARPADLQRLLSGTALVATARCSGSERSRSSTSRTTR